MNKKCYVTDSAPKKFVKKVSIAYFNIPRTLMGWPSVDAKYFYFQIKYTSKINTAIAILLCILPTKEQFLSQQNGSWLCKMRMHPDENKNDKNMLFFSKNQYKWWTTFWAPFQFYCYFFGRTENFSSLNFEIVQSGKLPLLYSLVNVTLMIMKTEWGSMTTRSRIRLTTKRTSMSANLWYATLCLRTRTGNAETMSRSSISMLFRWTSLHSFSTSPNRRVRSRVVSRPRSSLNLFSRMRDVTAWIAFVKKK